MNARLRAIAACTLVAAAGAVHADLQDEVQVYDDAINQPGERGLELHVNTTPRGRRTPDYPGEIPPEHALRVTPEFSWGYSREVELGLYLPTVLRPDGRYEPAGAKVRLKWLPIQPTDGRGGFAGVNFELSRLAQRYSLPRSNLEARFIAGWRTPDWLLAINPILGFGLSDGSSLGDRPSFDLGIKASRRMAEGIRGGLELYSGFGPLGRPLPHGAQDHRLFVAFDVDRGPLAFNVGIGRGLTAAADKWTLKAIFDIPFPQ